MTDFLYRWPEAAKFGRRVPKEKFYEQTTVNTAVREKFISDVQRITWAYKLAEATINLPGTTAVPEVQVFTIDSKATDVGEPILNAIDKAIPFPIIFEITRQSAGGSETQRLLLDRLAARRHHATVPTHSDHAPRSVRGAPAADDTARASPW